MLNIILGLASALFVVVLCFTCAGLKERLNDMTERYAKARRTAYTLSRLLERRARREQGLPQPRDSQGRWA